MRHNISESRLSMNTNFIVQTDYTDATASIEASHLISHLR